MPTAVVNTSNGTSFSEMKEAYVNNPYNTSAAPYLGPPSGNTLLRDGSTTNPISMSFFRGATFTNPYGTYVPTSDDISVEDDFLYDYAGTLNGKTF